MGDAVETCIDTYTSEDDDDMMAEPDIEDIAKGMVDELAKSFKQLVRMANTHHVKILSLKANLEAIGTRPEATSQSGPASATFVACLDQYNGLKGNVELNMMPSRESPERRYHVEVL